ncbi:MAG: TIM barrel protein, partial [Burkholderiales bacterium]
MANAPCSWGALELDVGASVTWDRVLDEIAATGYAGTELGDWGFMPSDSARLRDELDRRGLELLGAFVPAALWRAECHDPALEVALRTARLLVAVSRDEPVIVLSDDNASVRLRAERAGRVRRADGLDPAQWGRFAQGASWIAQSVREQTGLRTAFHPHCGGYVEAPWEIDELMDRTDAEALGLCLDTGHITFGGGQPEDVFARYTARVWHVHFKDCHPEIAERASREKWDYFTAVRKGLFYGLGGGEVDFARLVGELRK